MLYRGMRVRLRLYAGAGLSAIEAFELPPGAAADRHALAARGRGPRQVAQLALPEPGAVSRMSPPVGPGRLSQIELSTRQTGVRHPEQVVVSEFASTSL